MTIQIRPATEKDYSAICSLIADEDELFRVYPAGEFPLTVEQLKTLARVRKEFTVMVDDEQVIGFANLYNYQEGESAFIGNVVIDKSRRGKGLGQRLMGYMLERVFSQYDLPEARISVFNDNTTAILMYTDSGFQPYAIEARDDPKGRRLALIHMRTTREDYRAQQQLQHGW